jgi:hypothetical protein
MLVKACSFLVPNFKILAVFSLKSLKVTLKLNENAFIKWARIKKRETPTGNSLHSSFKIKTYFSFNPLFDRQQWISQQGI